MSKRSFVLQQVVLLLAVFCLIKGNIMPRLLQNCPANCAECLSPTYCVLCNTGYVPYVDGLSVYCQPQCTTIPNCLLCPFPSTCTQCKSGYKNTFKSCVKKS